MAITTDLTDFHTIETTPTSFEFTNYTIGGIPAVDTDYPIQGTQHLSAAMTKTGLGSIGVDFLSNPTWTAGWSFFVWGVFLPAGAVNTDALGGLRVLIGSATSAFKVWNVGGRDFGRYPYGGWMNFVVDPQTTADSTVGTPGTDQYRYAGLGVDCTSAISKGQPLGVDAIRFGRGELRVNGTETFTTIATVNDAQAAKWGLFQSEAGSYRWKGLMTLGHTTALAMTDSNKNIVVDNTRKVTAGFNKIEVRQAGTNINWTGINISALGTVSKGAFQMIDNATVSLNGCVFTDLDTLIFQSNANIQENTFRRCNTVTLGGAVMDGCLFDKSTGTVALASGGSVSSLTNTDFFSSGTGHAIEFTSGTSHTISTNTFSGYAATNGSTGNETIYVNIPSGSVTINAASSISYRTAGATVTVIVGQKTLTLTNLLSGSDIVLLEAGTSTIIESVDQNIGSTYAFSYSTPRNIDIGVIKPGYKVKYIRNYTLGTTDASLPIALELDRTYA